MLIIKKKILVVSGRQIESELNIYLLYKKSIVYITVSYIYIRNNKKTTKQYLGSTGKTKI